MPDPYYRPVGMTHPAPFVGAMTDLPSSIPITERAQLWPDLTQVTWRVVAAHDSFTLNFPRLDALKSMCCGIT